MASSAEFVGTGDSGDMNGSFICGYVGMIISFPAIHINLQAVLRRVGQWQ